MNKAEREEFQKLRQHIANCQTVPRESFVSRVVLHRLNEKMLQLEQAPSSGGSRGIWKGRKNKQKKPKRSAIESFFAFVRTLIIDLPFTLLLLSTVITHLAHEYYVHYVSPMIDAARWVNNDRLKNEYTYYDRPCDVSDITAKSIEEVILEDGINDADEAVDKFMVHGMGLFTNILDDQVSDDLRNYIRRRNYELSDEEIIPLDTPDGRHSFGINANEDPSVALALNQIGTHKLLHETLEKLLGPDPAVAEITAITVEPGAEAQGWHPDVKPLGSSIKYGRTFTHSYSLFIPLQNVTKRMGATELCPGTHYCSSEYLEDMCIEGGFQASESNSMDKAWKVGDGLMMNQKMWHRGGVYNPSRRERNPDRVVFILTFISRPNFGLDHRQLSHGTYFHIHPFMYGHTFQDLKNAQVSMSFPFSMFRSIGIWKPPNANWGYDWVTTSSLRIANGENGYHFEDLDHFVKHHPLSKRLPSFLHGVVKPESGWQFYIQDTIHRFRTFFFVIFVSFIITYLTVVLVIDFLESGKNQRLFSTLKRFLCISLIVLFLAKRAAETVKQTQFCRSVDSKTVYARPFLPKPRSRRQLEKLSKKSIFRPTTVPSKTDVLFGNRYDSKNIGNYINFLNYHPGNKKMRELLDTYTDLYHSYKDLPKVFEDEVVKVIDSNLDQFLLQNDFGEWTIMGDKERKNNILKHLTYGGTSQGLLFKALDKEAAVLFSDAKFGTKIRSSTAMKEKTLESLAHWRDEVLVKNINLLKLLKNSTKDVNFSASKANGGRFDLSTTYKLPSCPTYDESLLRTNSTKNFIGKSASHNFKVGDRILYSYQGSGYWLDGKIIHIEFNNYAYTERRFSDGLIERGGVFLKKVKPYVPLKEKDEICYIVRSCPSCKSTYIHGTVEVAYPDFTYDLDFESNDAEYGTDGEFVARRYEQEV